MMFDLKEAFRLIAQSWLVALGIRLPENPPEPGDFADDRKALLEDARALSRDAWAAAAILRSDLSNG